MRTGYGHPMSTFMRVLAFIAVILMVVRIIRRVRSEIITPMASKRSPWKVLGLARGADQPAIEQAWRRLIQENHPDRVAQMDPEIQALAAKRTQAINEAYDALRLK